MGRVIRLGGFAIAIALAFAAGRVSSRSHARASMWVQPPGDAGPPSSLPPWASQGFRDGETCADVFVDPG